MSLLVICERTESRNGKRRPISRVSRTCWTSRCDRGCLRLCWNGFGAPPRYPAEPAAARPAERDSSLERYYVSDTRYSTTGMFRRCPFPGPARPAQFLRNSDALVQCGGNAEAVPGCCCAKSSASTVPPFSCGNRWLPGRRPPHGRTAGACAPSRRSASLPRLLEHFELSLDEGIGGHVLRLGRMLRRTQ